MLYVYNFSNQDLKRHCENLSKNHKHELGIERARHRETQRQLEELQTTDTKLQTQLKVLGYYISNTMKNQWHFAQRQYRFEGLSIKDVCNKNSPFESPAKKTLRSCHPTRPSL